MPQELNILCCYSCKTYQVHIVKKVKIWKCKICNERQSVQRVYFQGSGQDCRVNVQKLNALRAEEAEEEAQYDDNDDEAIDQFYQPQVNSSDISCNKLGDNSELSVLPKISIGSISSSSGQSNLESVENEFLSKSAHISENTRQVVTVDKISSMNSIFESHGEIDLTFDA